MAVDDLIHLRAQLPEVFSTDAPVSDWDADWIFVPIDHPERFGDGDPEDELGTAVETALPPHRTGDGRPGFGAGDFDLTPILIPQPLLDTNYPGQPIANDWQSPMPPPDAFAFYLPYHHYFPTWWGVYIVLERAKELAQLLAQRTNGLLDDAHALKMVRLFLYAHEAFHHRVESFATRLEITHRQPIYREGFQKHFERTRDTDDCIEELLATAYAYRRVKEKFAFHNPGQAKAALAALTAYIEQCPPGYRRAPIAFKDSVFDRLRNEFAEVNLHDAISGLKRKEAELWTCYPHAFSGMSRINSRVNYTIHRHSPLAARLSLNLRYLRYRDLRDKLIRLGKCEPVRQGKGSHEIWRSPTGHRFPVPRHPRDLHTGLLSAILKQAGLQMSVSQFLEA